ncbi:outer membrane beta-barrel family protein [Robiginitalea myxolifaciens]|nr:outer membrane beta-barrel family protein [Robiginitalea myxolifaciens]
MRLPLLLAVMTCFCLQGQNAELSGFVRDVDGNPMPYANVVLLAAADSVAVKGSSADDTGFFIIRDLQPDLYYLTATYLGYRSLWVPLEIRGEIRIGALIMEPDSEQLEEVVVSARKPIIQRTADRLIFQVENTAVSQGTTWDILKSTPGIITARDNLEIRGRPASVYLNDRKVQLAPSEVLELLKGLSGDIISSVEVIPVPPASFEADDGPVINIRTSQNIVPGYKGSITLSQTTAIFPKYSAATSHYYKSGRFSVFGNYSFNPRKEVRQEEANINFIDDADQNFARWNRESERTRRSWGQQANILLEYQASPKDRLSLAGNWNYSPNRVSNYQLETMMRNGQGALDSTLQTTTGLEDDRLDFSADLNYRRDFNEEGANLKTNVHLTRSGLERLQEGTSDYFDPSGAFIRSFSFGTDAEQDIDILTAQADLYNPIPSGGLETGLKSSVIRTRNRIDFFDVNNSQPPFDIALSDRFEYDENVYAAYASMDKRWADWSLKLGFRMEHTEVRARSLTLNEINSQSYTEWFPSVFLQRDLDEDHSLALSYSRQLTRPNYADLNPFRFFLNENDFSEGNPNLVPAFSQNFNLNLSLNNTVYLDFYYRDNGAYIGSYSFQDNLNQTLLEINQNAEESISYGVDLTVSTSLFPFWSLYSYNSLFYEAETFMALESDIETFKNEVTGYYGYLGNYLDLSANGNLTGEVTLVYISGFLLGSYQMSETISLNVGLTQRLWEGRGRLSLVAEDLLGRANATFTSRYANQDNSIFYQPETQFVRLSFTYNFGNFRLENSGTGERNDEQKRIADE